MIQGGYKLVLWVRNEKVQNLPSVLSLIRKLSLTMFLATLGHITELKTIAIMLWNAAMMKKVKRQSKVSKLCFRKQPPSHSLSLSLTPPPPTYSCNYLSPCHHRCNICLTLSDGTAHKTIYFYNCTITEHLTRGIIGVNVRLHIWIYLQWQYNCVPGNGIYKYIYIYIFDNN